MFSLWISEGYSAREIAVIKRTSQASVRRVFKYWIDRSPEIIPNCSLVKYIICDRSFLNKRTGIYVILNSAYHQIIKAAYVVKEVARDLTKMYQQLKPFGLEPKCATVDGNPQQIKYLREARPSIIIQRCIVHVQRQGLSWYRRNPKRTDEKHLRKLFLAFIYVRTKKRLS